MKGDMLMAAIVLFCLALMACLVLRTNILYALLAGLVIFTLHGRQQGFSWKELGKMIGAGVKTSASVLLVFPLIGMLTALWRACGTLPFIICCAVDLIRPQILLLMTFLLNCGVSMLTGTAFGTAATMGTICVSVGMSMGMGTSAARRSDALRRIFRRPLLAGLNERAACERADGDEYL